LSWSRSQGVFGGISLNGSTLRADADVDKALYGKVVDRKVVLQGQMEAPAEALPLLEELSKCAK